MIIKFVGAKLIIFREVLSRNIQNKFYFPHLI